MTRREFDRLTKHNRGDGYMARDERCTYRDIRHLPHHGSGADHPTWTRDYLTDRQAELAIMRREGFLTALLETGGRFRAPARFLRQQGKTLLTGRI